METNPRDSALVSSAEDKETDEHNLAFYKDKLQKLGDKAFHGALLHNVRGIEWKSCVISGSNVNNQMLRPWKVAERVCTRRLDHAHSMACRATYLSVAGIETELAVGWSLHHSADDDAIYNYCEHTRAFLDAFRSFLIRATSHCAIVYHPGTDPCSLCHGNHYHVVFARPVTPAIDNDYNWKRIKGVIKAAQGRGKLSLRCQPVRNINAIMNYLSIPPRVWHGTNSPILLAIHQYKREQDATAVAHQEARKQAMIALAKDAAIRERKRQQDLAHLREWETAAKRRALESPPTAVEWMPLDIVAYPEEEEDEDFRREREAIAAIEAEEEQLPGDYPPRDLAAEEDYTAEQELLGDVEARGTD